MSHETQQNECMCYVVHRIQYNTVSVCVYTRLYAE